MVALDTPISLPALRSGVMLAWRWWVGELSGLVPERLREWIAPSHPVYDLSIGAKEAIVSWSDGEEAQQTLRLDLRSVEPAGNGGYPQGFSPPKGAQACVHLSDSLVIRREIDLPQSAERRARAIVGLDLDRQTPFPAGKAASDVQVIDHDPQAGRIRVGIAVVHRETLEAVRMLCERLNLKPLRVEADNPVFPDRPFNFLVADQASSAGRFRLRADLLVAAGLVLLIGLNVGLAFWRVDARLAMLTTELSTARKEAQATEKLRAQLVRTETESKLLADGRDKISALEALRSLTQVLPDNVWLFQMELSNGSGQIAGYAPSAADLLDRLDKSGAFTNPRFKAAITRADKMEQDRFEVEFDLAPRGKR